MNGALARFDANLDRVRLLGALHASLSSSTTAAIDASDLLRAQFVLAVSALDTYVHEVVLIGMRQIHLGARPSTPAYRNFRVSLEAFARAAPASSAWLEHEIRSQHSWKSFQSPEKVTEALRLITPNPIWAPLAEALRRDEQSLKRELTLIVDRRNKIAHEADADPVAPGTRWPIDPALTNDAIEFLSRLVHALSAIL